MITTRALLPLVPVCLALAAPAASATIPAPNFIFFGPPIAVPCALVATVCPASGPSPASLAPDWPSLPALPVVAASDEGARPPIQNAPLERTRGPGTHAVHVKPGDPATKPSAQFSEHPLFELDMGFLEERTAVQVAMATAPLPAGAAPFALTLTMLLIAASRSRPR